MTISNSNLLKPFITGTELPPFKEDVFSKTEEQFKKSPHGKLLFISGNENLVLRDPLIISPKRNHV
ncbi:hypothetical protein FSG70_025480 [Escherichia coli]|nr:hypothetical protein [Escherichia coli]